jgi:hypothetical protein
MTTIGAAVLMEAPTRIAQPTPSGPKTALSRFSPVHMADLEGQLRVEAV